MQVGGLGLVLRPQGFDIGARLTEIMLLGCVSLRVGKTIDPAGVADLLNWGFLVDDGPPAVVLQKDGSLLAGWRYRVETGR